MGARNITQIGLFEAAIVRAFSDEKVAGKLMSMGIIPGSQVMLTRIAPFKGGFCLKVNGHKIAVRYNEAESIEVE